MANATTAPPAMDECAVTAADRTAAAGGVPDHGVRDVHVDPGHPDRVGLARRQSRPACRRVRSEVSWVQTAYLIAEVIAIPLSGFLSRALGTRLLFAISAAGFTIARLPVRIRLHDHRDDPVARDPGISGRQASSRPCSPRSLHGVSTLKVPHRRPDHRPGRDAGADHRLRPSAAT